MKPRIREIIKETIQQIKEQHPLEVDLDNVEVAKDLALEQVLSSLVTSVIESPAFINILNKVAKDPKRFKFATEKQKGNVVDITILDRKAPFKREYLIYRLTLDLLRKQKL